jgi:hypothetical protein
MDQEIASSPVDRSDCGARPFVVLSHCRMIRIVDETSPSIVDQLKFASA